MSRGYQPAELDRRDDLLDATYATFLSRVAAGRGLDQAAVWELAEGRVWTGQQAAQIGLVDRLGGLEDAIGEARHVCTWLQTPRSPGSRRPAQRPARVAGALRQPGRPPRQLLAPRARNLTVAHHGLKPTLGDRKRP